MSILLLYTTLAITALLLIGVMLVAATGHRRNRRVATQLPARVHMRFTEDTVPREPRDWWNANFHWEDS